MTRNVVELPSSYSSVSTLVEAVTAEYVGKFPIDGEWTIPSERWMNVMRARRDGVVAANYEIATHLTQLYGSHSPYALASSIFARLTGPLTDLAIAQLEDDGSHPRSLSQYSRRKNNLSSAIQEVYCNRVYQKFLDRYKAFAAGLTLMGERLWREKDPQQMQRVSSRYVSLCKDAIEKGEPVIHFPFDSPYTSPQEKRDDLPRLWEMYAALVFPPPPKVRYLLDEVTNYSWSIMSSFPGARKENTRPRNIIGFEPQVAGFGAFSASEGEALEDGGFQFALNFAKDLKMWNKVLHLAGMGQRDYFPSRMLLFANHEHGHALFPSQITPFEETASDLPTVISAIEGLLYTNRYLDEESFIWRVEFENLITAILAQYGRAALENAPTDNSRGMDIYYHQRLFSMSSPAVAWY